jgi:hypothetical protein
LKRLEASNKPPPCPEPVIKTFYEGRDFPPGGEPPDPGPCELCGAEHGPPRGHVRYVIIGLPRDRDTGKILPEYLERWATPPHLHALRA